MSLGIPGDRNDIKHPLEFYPGVFLVFVTNWGTLNPLWYLRVQNRERVPKNLRFIIYPLLQNVFQTMPFSIMVLGHFRGFCRKVKRYQSQNQMVLPCSQIALPPFGLMMARCEKKCLDAKSYLDPQI